VQFVVGMLNNLTITLPLLLAAGMCSFSL